jgi:SAM-dependent methyltransferase
MEAVARHRTAMTRTFLSRPVQQALNDGVIAPGRTVFDYGCGRGGDLRQLRSLGYEAAGWDPAHAAAAKRHPADVVNLGFVINVIENPAERAETLRHAWALARDTLIVAARLDWEQSSVSGRPFHDGVMTSTGTFQKFYSQDNLRATIDSALGVSSVAAAPGIFYVFRHEGSSQELLARHVREGGRPKIGLIDLIYQQNPTLFAALEEFLEKHRRLPDVLELSEGSAIADTFGSIRAAFSLLRRKLGPARWPDIGTPTRKRSDTRFEENLPILQPLIDFLTERGRLPRPGEIHGETDLAAEFGSVRAAYSLIRRVTGTARWDAFEQRAKTDFLVYLALAAFGGRPKVSDLPDHLQADVKDFFGNYKTACSAADELLFRAGRRETIDETCKQSPIGKLTSEALYVHVNTIPFLDPTLRVYEGCARALTGTVENATILKMHRLKPQVSFLAYPDFETDPHPALHSSVISRMQDLRVTYRDFSQSINPPILHRKESFVATDHPGREKFERLTEQEERAGLLGHNDIGTRDGWNALLRESGFALKGHRLNKLKPLS